MRLIQSARRLGVAAGCSVAMLAAADASVPSAAHAVQVNWNCGVQPTGTWCMYSVRHSYWRSKAHYPGSYVCTKLIRDSDGGFIGQACGTSDAEYTFGGPLVLAKPLSYNGSSPHTIFGNAWY